MGVASIVHLFVFPVKPYASLDEQITRNIAVLGDYASVGSPLDPDEVKDSERPTRLKIPGQQKDEGKTGTAIKESVRDVVVGGSNYIVKDVKFTVTQAVEPMEKGFSRINEKLHKISRNNKKHEKITQNDELTPSARIIRGIDDPLLAGSVSDSGVARGRKSHHHRRPAGYTSAESGGESSDQSYGYQIHGRRWFTKD